MEQRGFSLIEILISMALVLLLLVGTAELITMSIWAKRKGDVTAGLVRSFCSRAESLKSLAFGPQGLPAGDYAETARDEGGRGLFLHEWTVEDAGERSQRVRLRVTPAGHPESAASLTLWISKGLGFRP